MHCDVYYEALDIVMKLLIMFLCPGPTESSFGGHINIYIWKTLLSMTKKILQFIIRLPVFS